MFCTLSELLQDFPWEEQGWTIEHVDDAPRQKNGIDCGVFVIMMGYCLATGRSYRSFQQADMPACRRWITLCLLNRVVPF